ncbi:A24 family peptidase [Vibrio astriarenae]
MIIPLLVIISLLSIFVCYSDLVYRRIPNQTLVFLSLCIVCISMANIKASWIMPYILVLILTMMFYSINVIAGGDLKLLAVFFIAVSPDHYYLVIFLMLSVGGVLAIIYLMYGLLTKKVDVIREKGFPYSLAICPSCLFGIFASL